MMTWMELLLTCVFRCGLPRPGLWGGNGSASASASENGGVNDGDDGAHENYHESGNVYVYLAKTTQVESCHASNDSCGLFPTDYFPSLSSRTGASPRDLLRPTGSICPWGRNPCRTRTGCHYCRLYRPFFPVSLGNSQIPLSVVSGCSHAAELICDDLSHPRC